MIIDRRALVLITGGALGAYLYMQPGSVEAPVAKQIGAKSEPAFLGRVRTRDYVAELRSALAGRTSLIAVVVTRHYVHTQTISRSFLGFESHATIVVTYRVEYAVGFDLTKLRITQNESGLLIEAGAPQLVTSPAVQLLSHDIAERGLIVDEEAALVELQQGIALAAQRRAPLVLNEAAVIVASKASLAKVIRRLTGPSSSLRISDSDRGEN